MNDSSTQNLIYALAASPDFAEDATCFAGGTQGLARSTDGGVTWQDAYTSLSPVSPIVTASVAVSPTFASDDTVFAGGIGAVLCSTDRGGTWTLAELPSPPPFVSSLAISPNYERDGTLFAGTAEDGVFTSRNRGANWVGWNFGLLDLNVFDLAISPGFAEDETLFAAVETGIFRSTNGGRAWREVDFPIDCAPVLRLALSPNFAEDGIVFAGTEAQGLWASIDRGRSWVRLAEHQLTGSVDSILLSSNYPATPDLVVLHDLQSLISHDGAQTWQPWPPQPAAEREFSAILAPSGLHAGAPLIVGLPEGGALRI